MYLDPVFSDREADFQLPENSFEHKIQPVQDLITNND